MPKPTKTTRPTPTVQFTPTAKPAPTRQPTLASRLAATNAPTAAGTAIPAACLKMQYVTDVTIPDGTRLDPGATFVKTWRIRNSGQCAWENVNLVFSTGDPLAGETTAIPTTAAGKTVEVSVDLTAPSTPGRYQGAWVLQSGGTTFGQLTVVIVSGNPVVAQPTAASPGSSDPTAAPSAVCECGYDAYNCKSFSTHSQAQQCFDYCVSIGAGDIHRLDQDNDKRVCESLP